MNTEELLGLHDVAKEKIKALDELFLKSKLYTKSKEYLDLLNFINRFPKLSPYNAFLVHMQNAGVELVFTRSKWLSYGRKVKPFARPLVILIPFGPVDFVYDISDTEKMDPKELNFIPERLTNPFYTHGELNIIYYHQTIHNCKKENIIIKLNEMQKSVAGYADHKGDDYLIILNKILGENELFSTLIHELAHIFCGHLGNYKKRWWEDRRGLHKDLRELEAESISFLVCKRYRLNTKSESYLSNYVSNFEEMPQISLDTILTISGHIEKMGTNTFRPKKNN